MWMLAITPVPGCTPPASLITCARLPQRLIDLATRRQVLVGGDHQLLKLGEPLGSDQLLQAVVAMHRLPAGVNRERRLSAEHGRGQSELIGGAEPFVIALGEQPPTQADVCIARTPIRTVAGVCWPVRGDRQRLVGTISPS